jgi:hypothetical protein
MLGRAKSIFVSRTFWSGIASVILGLLPVLGVEPDTLTDGADLGERLYGAAVLVAGAGAIWGRFMATKQVAVKSPITSEVTLR